MIKGQHMAERNGVETLESSMSKHKQKIDVVCNVLADMTMLFRVIKDIDQSMMHCAFRDNLNMKYQKRKRSDQKFNKWKNRR